MRHLRRLGVRSRILLDGLRCSKFRRLAGQLDGFATAVAARQNFHRRIVAVAHHRGRTLDTRCALYGTLAEQVAQSAAGPGGIESNDCRQRSDRHTSKPISKTSSHVGHPRSLGTLFRKDLRKIYRLCYSVKSGRPSRLGKTLPSVSAKYKKKAANVTMNPVNRPIALLYPLRSPVVDRAFEGEIAFEPCPLPNASFLFDEMLRISIPP